MKRYRLIQTACLAAMAVGLASCSQDDLASLGVAEGAPVTFTATGLAMPQVETRATTDGTWEEGMMVGVKIGSEAKEYAVSPDATDPTKATLAATQGVTPFYWANATETKSVEAWYPYTVGQTAMPSVVVQQDQSVEANYLASDLLGTSQEVSYGDTDLQFAHRTAKITLNFTETAGSRFSMKDAEVVLYNLSTTNGNPATIRCFKATEDGTIYHALIAPQTFAAGNALFYVKFAEGSPHSYSPDVAIDFKAGYQYVFTITVTDTGMKVTVGEAIPWGDEVNSENSMVASEDGYYVTTDADGRLTYYVSSEAGLNAWRDYTDRYVELMTEANRFTNLVLLNDITLTKNADGSSNWTPISRYYGTVEGNGHTIDNMVVHRSDEYDDAAFIGTLDLDACVRNLTIGSGSSFKSISAVASIAVTCLDSRIINCHSAATLEGDFYYRQIFSEHGLIGGIVTGCRGYDASYLIGCSFSGKMTATTTTQEALSIHMGGICGWCINDYSSYSGSAGTMHIVGCANYGEMVLKDISGSTLSHVGGIVGSHQSEGPAINSYVTSCAMTGTMSFENVTSTNINSDGAIGRMELSSASHVYWDSGSIAAEWRQPYRSDDSTYDTLQEVNGVSMNWATAVDNMNAAIETWNAANGNLCPVHYVLTGNKPVLMKNQE